MKARTEAALIGTTMGFLAGMGGSLLVQGVTDTCSMLLLLEHVALAVVACGAVAWAWNYLMGGEG